MRSVPLEPLSVPGRVENLAESLAALRRYVAAASQRAGLDARATQRLTLAVDEIATNAIVHGYPPDAPAPMLEVRATIDPDSLRITLDDHGAAYNPLQQDTPRDLDAPLERRTAGGLGVYLALRSVDAFHYQRIGSVNRNSFTMKHRSAKT